MLKDMPAQTRPREKLLARGPAALADAELLALLLRTGLKGTGVLQLAEQLLDRFGSISGLLHASHVRLAEVKGLGPAKRAELAAVLELQSEFGDMIERCPGRTLAQRQSVFLRMQRVRNHMATRCEQELDIPELARMASYSPWHFIRAFHSVYGETPHAYLVNRRLERARRLVRSSPLAISEIASASGFENRCAFSRLFKQRFGISAAALRREHGIGLRPGRARRCESDELPRRAVSATRSANSGQLSAATDF